MMMMTMIIMTVMTMVLWIGSKNRYDISDGDDDVVDDYDDDVIKHCPPAPMLQCAKLFIIITTC